MIKKILLSLLFPAIVCAQPVNQQRIQDEGGTAIPYNKLDCVGGGITCSGTTPNVTISVPSPTPAATPTLQQVTTAGATSSVATTFSGGLSSRIAGQANTVELGEGLSGGKTGSTNIGTNNALGSGATQLATVVGFSNSLTGTSTTHIASVFGNANIALDNSGGAGPFKGAILFGYGNTSSNFGVNGGNTTVGTLNDNLGNLSTIVGYDNNASIGAATAGDQGDYVTIVGASNASLFNQDDITIVGNNDTILHSDVTAVGNGIGSTAASRAYLGGSTQQVVLSEAYTLPLTDGTAGKFLQTQGAGAVSFSNNFLDNQAVTFGTGVDASIYYDAVDLVINPKLVGTGLVKIGPTANMDLSINEMGLCGAGLASTSIVNGVCSGAKRGVLAFTFTKSGGTGVAANIASVLNYSNTSVNANSVGVQSTYNINAGGTGSNSHRAFAVSPSATGITGLGSGTYQIRGYLMNAISAPADATGMTIYQIGFQQNQFTAFPSATAEFIASMVLEDDVLITDDDKLYFEGTGGSTPTKGDTYMLYNSGATELQTFVGGAQMLGLQTNAFGVFATTPATQYNTAGNLSVINAGGAGNKWYDDTDCDGGLGGTAYTIGDVVAALKLYGFLAP